MIKFEATETHGFETAIRGMRNPMNSWSRSDSQFDVGYFGDDGCEIEHYDVIVGEDDLDLMQRLICAGSDHSKFMRMINVTCDITAPLYWWKEFDTYKVGTVANSCSTMHKIHAREIALDDFSHEKLNERSRAVLEDVIHVMNIARIKYIEEHDKDEWWQMIQLLPTSYNQKRTVQLNYAVLRNMYHARKNHKLDEWREFCEWVEWLPYADDLICQ